MYTIIFGMQLSWQLLLILILKELCEWQLEENEDVISQLKADEKGNDMEKYVSFSSSTD